MNMDIHTKKIEKCVHRKCSHKKRNIFSVIFTVSTQCHNVSAIIIIKTKKISAIISESRRVPEFHDVLFCHAVLQMTALSIGPFVLATVALWPASNKCEVLSEAENRSTLVLKKIPVQMLKTVENIGCMLSLILKLGSFAIADTYRRVNICTCLKTTPCSMLAAVMYAVEAVIMQFVSVTVYQPSANAI